MHGNYRSRYLLAMPVLVGAQLVETANAMEPPLSCRVGTNTIASNLRPGGANQFVALRKTTVNGVMQETPVIAYYDLPPPNSAKNFPPEAGLYLYTCDDPECSSGTTKQLEQSAAVHSVDLSMVLQGAEQKAVVLSYDRDTADQGVRQYYCNDLTCTNPTTTRWTTGTQYTPQLTLTLDESPFLVWGSHRPYSSSKSVDLVTCHCSNASCNPLPTCHVIDDQENNGWYPATLQRQGLQPLIAHSSASSAAVFQCTETDCSAGVNHTIAGPAAGSSTGYTNIARHPGGKPLVAYAAFTKSDEDLGVPMLAVCANENCAGETSRALDSTERPLRLVRLAIRPNGRGLVTWGEEVNGSGSALRYYQCASRDCAGGRPGIVVANPEVGHALAMRSDGVAVVAFRPAGTGTIKLAFCGLPDDRIFIDDFDL